MKLSMTLLSLLCISFSAFAGQVPNPEIQTGTLDLKQFTHVIASPFFARALAKATSAVNGWKIRMDYEDDLRSRTTIEAVTVTVVGRKINERGDKPSVVYQKSQFTAVGLNGGWQVSSPVVTVTPISENEFLAFSEN
jgi:hypothetical protein